MDEEVLLLPLKDAGTAVAGVGIEAIGVAGVAGVAGLRGIRSECLKTIGSNLRRAGVGGKDSS